MTGVGGALRKGGKADVQHGERAGMAAGQQGCRAGLGEDRLPAVMVLSLK